MEFPTIRIIVIWGLYWGSGSEICRGYLGSLCWDLCRGGGGVTGLIRTPTTKSHEHA